MKCPNCGNTDRTQMMGHEIRGVYDGVLFWSCGACGWAFARDWGDWERMKEASEEYADRYNADRYRT